MDFCSIFSFEIDVQVYDFNCEAVGFIKIGGGMKLSF